MFPQFNQELLNELEIKQLTDHVLVVEAVAVHDGADVTREIAIRTREF